MLRASLLAVLALAVPAAAQTGASLNQLPPQFQGVEVAEKLGKSVDLDLTFVAENGHPAPLRQYFRKNRPVILNLVYYSCPMLCNLVLNGQTRAMQDLPWVAGDQYEVVTVSIDPTETFQLASAKRASYLESLGRPAPGWNFLTDHQGNVKKLAEQVGFRYRWDEKTNQYAHAAVILVLTPEGKVSRYLYGVKLNPRDLRLALAEAAKERFAVSIERVLLMCFHYDPQAGSYVIFATNIMRAGGVLVVLVLGLAMFRLWRRERFAA